MVYVVWYNVFEIYISDVNLKRFTIKFFFWFDHSGGALYYIFCVLCLCNELLQIFNFSFEVLVLVILVHKFKY